MRASWSRIIEQVEEAGGRLWLEGGKLRYRLPKDRQELVELLRAHKQELYRALQALADQAARRCYNCGSSTWWRGDADSPWICYGCRPPYPWVRPGEVVGPPLEVRWEWSPSEGKMRLASGGE